MKKYIYIFTLLCVNIAFSQKSTNGIITYKLRISENLLDEKKQKKEYLSVFRAINNSLKENADKVTYKLYFNNNESLFVVDKFLENEGDKSVKYFKTLANLKHIFYMDKKNDLKLTQKQAYGEQFIIEEKISSFKWNITNETKKIGNYLCYKATGVLTVTNSKGIFKKPVVVWFAPQIPVNFGPMGYGGLSGLILELSINKVFNYYVSKIELNTKDNEKLKEPARGKRISRKEFEDIGKKIIRERRKSF